MYYCNILRVEQLWYIGRVVFKSKIFAFTSKDVLIALNIELLQLVIMLYSKIVICCRGRDSQITFGRQNEQK